jgi:hypothetical protein
LGQKTCWPIFTISGPRNWQKIMISRAGNSENGSAIYLGPETDVMVQFLAPETGVMGERNFMFYAALNLIMCFSVFVYYLKFT